MKYYFERLLLQIREEYAQQYYPLVVALSVCVVITFCFTVGFYWGHKKAAEELMFHIEQESFSDKVFSSLCALYDMDEEENSENNIEQAPSRVPLYYAELVGFASEQKAQNYVRQLQKDGLQALVHKRKTVSAQGKTSYWYQVVTDAMKKNELEQFIGLIAQRDHLKQIKIHEFTA